MLRSVSALVLCVVSLAVVAPAEASVAAQNTNTPGVTANSVKLGGVVDQTGHGTIISKHILAGYNLAISEVNAHGGVNGRKIEYIAESDNYDPSQTLPKLKKVVESDGVFAILGVFGSDDAGVAAPYLEKAKIPFFDPIGGGVDIKAKRWIWQTEPDYAREGQVIAKYATTSLHVKRMAVLYQTGIGESQLAAIKKTLSKYHADVVAEAPYGAADTSFAGQALKFAQASPDLVVLNGTPSPTSYFLQYAAQAGLKPRAGFIANYPMGDPLWLALIGSNGEGNRVSSYADLTGRNKVATAYRNAINKYHGEAYSNYGLYGYFNAVLLLKAMKLCGKNLTRTALQSVLNTRFRRYDTGFTGRINWTPTQHYGARQFKIYLIHNRAFKPVSGWLTP